MDADHESFSPADPDVPAVAPAAGEVRSVYRGHKLLTMSVGMLFAGVGVIMSLSLASCQSSGAAAGPGGVAGGGRNVPAAAPTREETETLAKVPAAALSNLTAEPEMRVRLAAAIGEVELRGYTAPPAGSKTAPAVTPVFLGPIGGQAGPMEFASPLRVKMMADGWLLTDANGRQLQLQSPSEVVVTASSATWSMGAGVPLAEQKNVAPGPMVMVTPAGMTTGAPYPGRIWLTPRSDTPSPAFDVIEHVGLEKYLAGVVVKEMYNHWPREAFKVQAVCARTYALHERSRRRAARAFDVESTTRDQAYAGAATNRNAIEAVNATRGVVMAFEGELLRTYYSSTCGGRTAAAKDTWPITAGYEYNLAAPIQAHTREFLCQDSPLFSWTVTRSADELTRRIRAFGEAQKQLVRQISAIHGLEPMEFAPTGRPSYYKLIEPGGKWYRVNAEHLRLACNTNVAGLAPVTSKTRVNSGDVQFTVTRPPAGSRLTPEQALAATTVQISGRGFGHGVGMCQYCTRAMAARGDGWQVMMERFYPGARIVKAYP